jgi:hypothetical protein
VVISAAQAAEADAPVAKLVKLGSARELAVRLRNFRGFTFFLTNSSCRDDIAPAVGAFTQHYEDEAPARTRFPRHLGGRTWRMA